MTSQEAVTEAAMQALEAAVETGQGIAVAVVVRDTGDPVTWVVRVERAIGVKLYGERSGQSISLRRLT